MVVHALGHWLPPNSSVMADPLNLFGLPYNKQTYKRNRRQVVPRYIRGTPSGSVVLSDGSVLRCVMSQRQADTQTPSLTGSLSGEDALPLGDSSDSGSPSPHLARVKPSPSTSAPTSIEHQHLLANARWNVEPVGPTTVEIELISAHSLLMGGCMRYVASLDDGSCAVKVGSGLFSTPQHSLVPVTSSDHFQHVPIDFQKNMVQWRTC